MLNAIDIKVPKDKGHYVSQLLSLHRKIQITKPKHCKCCDSQSLEALGLKNSIEFWKCKECAYIFNTSKTADFIEEYVRELKNDHESKKVESSDFLKPALSWFRHKKLKIMDFGCGNSMLPDKLRREGHRVVAVDILPPVVHHRDRLTGNIMELDIPLCSFDLIYANGVFEFVSEPKFILKRLFSLLKEDGMVLLTLNSDADELSDKFNILKNEQKAGHCSWYTTSTVEKMIEKMGRNIVYINSNTILAR